MKNKKGWITGSIIVSLIAIALSLFTITTKVVKWAKRGYVFPPAAGVKK